MKETPLIVTNITAGGRKGLQENTSNHFMPKKIENLGKMYSSKIED